MRPGLALEQEVAELFRRAGFDVESPATLTGARARHTVDVLVKYDNPLGDLETWVVECKDLAGRAKKEHVLTLLALVNDTGVSHGILVSRNGFQRGARDAARHTSLLLRSPTELAARVEVVSASGRAVRSRSTMASAIDALSEREKIVLTLYYFEGLTVSEIGYVLDVDYKRVSRLRAAAEASVGRTFLQPIIGISN